jgi:transcriptional regulator
MYQPPAFREERIETLHGLMRAHPLATLVCAGPDGIEAHHLPLLLDGNVSEDSKFGALSGHFAKANPLRQALESAPDGLPVIAIFHGPEHYISPAWYPSKQIDGKVVPTWNYTVVHAHGVLRPMADADRLRAHLDDLSASQEAGRPEPWAPSDAPAKFIANMMKGIIGFDFEIARLDGKWKLGQNRDDADRAGMLRGLAGEEADAGAAELAAVTRAETL